MSQGSATSIWDHGFSCYFPGFSVHHPGPWVLGLSRVLGFLGLLRVLGPMFFYAYALCGVIWVVLFKLMWNLKNIDSHFHLEVWKISLKQPLPYFQTIYIYIYIFIYSLWMSLFSRSFWRRKNRKACETLYKSIVSYVDLNK